MKQVPLTQGIFTYVDDHDFDFLSQWHWYAGKVGNGTYRAMRKETVNGKTYTIYMHRVILNAPDRVIVDHRDGNPLNNQRHNLRLCNRKQNGYNKRIHNTVKLKRTSLYKGVSLAGERWRARIYVDGKNVSLGFYQTEIEAALAYDKAARHYFGTFAHCNFEGATTLCLNTNTNQHLNESSQKVSGNPVEEAII